MFNAVEKVFLLSSFPLSQINWLILHQQAIVQHFSGSLRRIQVQLHMHSADCR